VTYIGGARLAFTTGSFVVTPIFFSWGDIGQLAVHGTVNDLAMSGARPLYLSAASSSTERPGGSTTCAGGGIYACRGGTGRGTVCDRRHQGGDRGKGDQIFITLPASASLRMT